MATFISNAQNLVAQELAVQYKIDPNLITSITLDTDFVLIDYVEHFENEEIAFCQKRIHRSV